MFKSVCFRYIWKTADIDEIRLLGSVIILEKGNSSINPSVQLRKHRYPPIRFAVFGLTLTPNEYGILQQ
jgi:hypothetical protein